MPRYGMIVWFVPQAWKEVVIVKKTVIVIGDATRTQVRAVRLRVLKQGHTPQTRRVAFDEFYVGAITLVEKYATDEERSAINDRGAVEEIARFAAKHLETFGDIGAIVLSEPDWRLISDTDFTWVTSVLDARRADEFNYWIIRPDGSVELA